MTAVGYIHYERSATMNLPGSWGKLSRAMGQVATLGQVDDNLTAIQARVQIISERISRMMSRISALPEGVRQTALADTQRITANLTERASIARRGEDALRLLDEIEREVATVEQTIDQNRVEAGLDAPPWSAGTSRTPLFVLSGLGIGAGILWFMTRGRRRPRRRSRRQWR